MSLQLVKVTPAVQCFQSATAFAPGELWGLLHALATEDSPLHVPCCAQVREAYVSHVYIVSATMTTAYILPKIQANTKSCKVCWGSESRLQIYPISAKHSRTY